MVSSVTPERRQIYERLLLAVALPLVAGTVNAVGFLELGCFTSHMTGNTTLIGDELANGHWSGAARAGAVVAAFFLGAFCCTLLAERAQAKSKGRYFQPLVWELVALLVFAYLRHEHAANWHPYWMRELLCFAMGIQNAMITSISSAVVRTTHLTGLITDTAIELGRLWSWTLQWWLSRAEHDPGFLKALRSQRDLSNLRLHVSILGSFILGAYVGPQLYAGLGNGAFVVPCGFLLVLLVFDWMLGIRGKITSPT